MTDADRAAILAEIAALIGDADRDSLPQPNFTVADMAAELGVSPDVALKRLKRLEQSGVLGSQMVIDGGHRRLVFWKK
ncbi:MAG: winged helix-turn-helix domain-containing protein [Planctomycetaceae bacterium]|nr:MAG: winged helix-turn-helix domain-containing protein [Planctomycetaceae bacterium]